jgi:adenylate cyclase
MRCLLRCAIRCGTTPPIGNDEALDEAFVLAMRGVALDPDESTCHSLLAQVHHLRGEFDLCLQQMRRSVELNPTNQWNMADMGMMLNYAGEPEQALDWFARALHVDPYFDPPWYWREYGIAFLLLQRNDEAAGMFNRLRDRYYRHLALKAAGHSLRGDIESARREAAECLSVRPGFSIRHYFAKSPFRRPSDVERLASGMRLAGLPE